MSCAALALDVSYDRNWNQRAHICQGQRHGFEIAEYSDGMDSVRLSMSQSSLEMLGKQIRFFMCRDDFFAQKISAESIMKIPYLALVFCLLWFSRDLRKAQTFLFLSPMIEKWLLNPSTRFEPTFSSPDTFQVQILTKIYDKTRVYMRTKAKFRFFLVDFVPFLKFRIGHWTHNNNWSGSRRRNDQETTLLVTCSAVCF